MIDLASAYSSTLPGQTKTAAKNLWITWVHIYNNTNCNSLFIIIYNSNLYIMNDYGHSMKNDLIPYTRMTMGTLASAESSRLWTMGTVLVFNTGMKYRRK